MDDVQLAFRRLMKHRVATLAGVVTLAVAIAAAAATWSLLSAVLMRPLPVESPDRLVIVGQQELRGPDGGALLNTHVYPVYPFVRDSEVFERVAAGGMWSNLVGIGDRPVQANVYFASHNYFEVLGVRIPLGRSFDRDDDRPGAPLVTVLSDRYWWRTFDASPAVIGRRVTVAGRPATVIGVAARGFRGLDLAQAPDLYLPLHIVADVGSPTTNYFAVTDHGSSPTAWVTILGRLGPKVSVAQATARLNGLSASGEPRPARFGLTGVSAAAIPAAARVSMVRFTRLVAITVALLLLIGSATVGMLLLVRTGARRGEFAMCLALGASRARLARGVVVEGALMAVAGAVFALPIAQWLFSGVRTFQLPGNVGIELLELSVDGRALAAAAGSALAGTLIIAIIAGIFGFPPDLREALRTGAGATSPPAARRTQSVLVAGQVAVAMVLVAGAGLFARSVAAALSLNPGFETSRIVNTSINLARYGYTPERAAAFFEDLRARLAASPAIASVSLTESQGGMAGRLSIDGQPRRFPSMISFVAVDQHYFATTGNRVTSGRDFSADDRAGSKLVAIVSRSFSRMMSNGGNPIGQHIAMHWSRPGLPPDELEVVGVVSDVITNVGVLQPLVMYRPVAQAAPGTSGTMVVRAASEAGAAKGLVMSAVRAIDRAVTPGPMLTIDERLSSQMAPQRFGAILMGALGFIAVLLAAVGTFVLAESSGVRRRREMAIRAALGAKRSRLGAAVLAETGSLVGFGLIVGVVAIWFGATSIHAFLFRVEPLDPLTLASVAILLILLAVAASLKSALATARVDLSRALRDE